MPDFCDPSATNDSGTLGFSPSPAGYTDSGTYQPIIPNCMPSSYPSGRFSLIVLRTTLSAARRSAGSAARYWARENGPGKTGSYLNIQHLREQLKGSKRKAEEELKDHELLRLRTDRIR